MDRYSRFSFYIIHAAFNYELISTQLCDKIEGLAERYYPLDYRLLTTCVRLHGRDIITELKYGLHGCALYTTYEAADIDRLNSFYESKHYWYGAKTLLDEGVASHAVAHMEAGAGMAVYTDVVFSRLLKGYLPLNVIKKVINKVTGRNFDSVYKSYQLGKLKDKHLVYFFDDFLFFELVDLMAVINFVPVRGMGDMLYSLHKENKDGAKNLEALYEGYHRLGIYHGRKLLGISSKREFRTATAERLSEFDHEAFLAV